MRYRRQGIMRRLIELPSTELARMSEVPCFCDAILYTTSSSSGLKSPLFAADFLAPIGADGIAAVRQDASLFTAECRGLSQR